MKFRGFAVAAAVLSLLSVSGTALAEETPATGANPPAEEAAKPDPWHGFSITLTGVTDYRDRGISQSDEDPAIQASLDWVHDSGIYLGVWGSNVDFNDGGQADYEIDVYGGYTTEWAGFEWDFMANAIFYPGAAESLDYDLYEFSTIVSRSFGIANTKVKLIYSPDNSGDSGTGLYSSFAGDVPILETGVSVTSSYGHQYVDNKINYGVGTYNDWSLGLGYSWQGFDFALKYIDTDLDKFQCITGCDATAMFSVARTFGGAE